MRTSNDIRKDFPIFDDNKIAYLDSAATSQKPRCVLDSIKKFYETQNANPHRGAYSLGVSATKAYNDCRDTVAKFINAKSSDEIIFTKNSTESLNLIANSYGLDNLTEGDEIALSIMEHHSMIVPWQKVASVKKAVLKYMYLNGDYQIDEAEIEKKITDKTKVVGILSVSNALGTINDYKKIIDKAHSVGAVVVLDVTQSIAHMPLDVQNIDADFVVFSAHKMYGPLGIGILYGKKKLLDNMTPFLLGGHMIEYVYEDHTTFANTPDKFEAGTQNADGAVGLKSAIEYILDVGYPNIEKIEKELTKYAYDELSKLDFVKLYCTKDLSHHTSVISFNINGVHSHDVSSILDMYGVCIRAGNHCAQPLMRFLEIDGTCRISLAIYNTKKDIDRLVNALKKVYKTFKKYVEEK